MAERRETGRAEGEIGEGERIDDYVHGALVGGTLSLTELREAALHLAVYGGWSRGGAPTLSANLPKNWSASFLAVPWINRAPTWAILPPTCASTS